HCASHSSKIAAVQTRINPTILRENRALPPQNPAKIAPKCQVHYIVSNPAKGAHGDQPLNRAI
ncbi:MAG: hypothetical protein ABSH34_33655, partial [Verrucomicrobiota bacterium]